MRLRRRPSEQEQLLLDSELFDERWYGERAGVRLDRGEAVRHYLDHGVGLGIAPHPLFDPGYVRRRLGPRRRARLGEGDPLTFVIRHELELPTHPLLAARAAGLVQGDLATWIEQRYAAWPQQPSGSPVSEPVVTVLITCVAAPEHALVAARAAAETASGADVAAEILLVDATGSPADGIVLDALLGLPGVRVSRAGADPAAELVVLLHDDAVPERGWLTPLLGALEAPAVLAASPLLVAPSGAIESAGAVYPAPGGLPYRLLADFPAEDAGALGALRLPALTGGALALRRDDLADLGVRDGLGDLTETDLCRRLAATRPGRFRLVTESRVRHRPHPVDLDARARFADLGQSRPSGADEQRIWSACGYRLIGHEVQPPGTGLPRRLGLVEPVVVRESRLQITEVPRPLRWAIKNPAPSNPDERWGDTHFARALARALRGLGHEAVIDHHGAWERRTARHDDIDLVLRGPHPFDPTPEHPSIAWVISHPETVTEEEAHRYDAVVAASVPWARRRSVDWGIGIEPLLQATDPDLFNPERARPDSGAELLFVGSSRGEYRAIVRDAIEAGLPLSVYGANWEHLIPPAHLVGTYLPNDEVGLAYAAAGVVLNDHFEDMRREGFLSNRLFDAVASGARVITDDVSGLGDLFGGSVQVYRDVDDLRRLFQDAPREQVFGDREARIATARRIGHEHSFAARAGVLVELGRAVLHERGRS
ncbi:glycosyltransferase [Nocardioides sp. BP30]|uniref:glycosyltransferase family protein n=1 Tax=Nocardioides sp. BP30 TaxID=3036374 RepID=UPI0024686339|nr:glycosyltransferase [Nocardioides sp. BP30]WGL53697.1 glycosyltransferase [Nocardioides sp. BP30]